MSTIRDLCDPAYTIPGRPELSISAKAMIKELEGQLERKREESDQLELQRREIAGAREVLMHVLARIKSGQVVL